jgi:hypothetical protein
MATSLPERLGLILRYFNTTLFDLAQEMGYERSEKLKRVQDGKGAPSFEFLQDLKKALPSLSLDWFITDSGPMVVAKENGIHIRIDNRTSLIPFVSISEANNYPKKVNDLGYISGLPIYDDVTYLEETYRDFEVGSSNKIGPDLQFKDIARGVHVADFSKDRKNYLESIFVVVLQDEIRWVRGKEAVKGVKEAWRIVEFRRSVKV